MSWKKIAFASATTLVFLLGIFLFNSSENRAKDVKTSAVSKFADVKPIEPNQPIESVKPVQPVGAVAENLQSLWQQVDDSDMFEHHKLKTEAKNISQLVKTRPGEAKKFVFDKINNLASTSLPATFFFLEHFLKNAEKPVAEVIEILRIPNHVSKHSMRANSERRNLNKAKAFVLEMAFEQHHVWTGSRSLPEVLESELIHLAKSESDLDLAASAIQKLKRHYQYDPTQLSKMISTRPQAERSQLSAIFR